MDKEKVIEALNNVSKKLDEAIAIIDDAIKETAAPDAEPTSTATAAPATVAEEAKEEQKVTIDDLRKKLAAMAGNGYKAAVKKLLEKYGSTKISGVDPKDYENLMKDALEVENAK